MSKKEILTPTTTNCYSRGVTYTAETSTLESSANWNALETVMPESDGRVQLEVLMDEPTRIFRLLISDPDQAAE